ncbi:amino acid oxidase [Tumebacillus avium]|uniref:Amino acid oxidase n=1 Tax=Tumebacillus avium TaxID=1903704 RepID=A0A1Y0ITL0_9BACL|nr:FAD-binding oxidoreductase [Tumebacillus avium]ARU63952.1 amino acid oxidase [Tumebacillus avium]
MNLKTGPLLWLDSLPEPPQYPRLEEDISCAVLVIGGGEAGALTSYHLHQAGVDVVLVDRRTIGFGSTSANTGLLQFGNDKPLTSCINTFGEANGVRYYKLCEKAVGDLETLSGQLEIFPDYVRRDSLYYATNAEDVPALQKEYEALKQYGYDVTYLQKADIEQKFSFSKAAAIYARGDAEINPYKLANGLTLTAHKKGMRVYQETEITTHITQDDHLVFFTKDRRQIKAQKAVIATGYETQEIKRNSNALINSSYAIATQPLDDFPGWHNRCLIWETARPYLYIRTTADNRILAGGLDEATNIEAERDAKLLHKKDLLLQEVQQLFPQLPDLRVDYFWSAAFGETHDGYPLIGTQPEFPHCYFPLGYGGNGTVYSTIAAQVLTGLITEGRHPDADMFRFDR